MSDDEAIEWSFSGGMIYTVRGPTTAPWSGPRPFGGDAGEQAQRKDRMARVVKAILARPALLHGVGNSAPQLEEDWRPATSDLELMTISSDDLPLSGGVRYAIGVDHGSEPATTVVAPTCARCSHTFTAKPDGFVDEALETEIAAHQERCFVVGDYVRWWPIGSDVDRHADGEMASANTFRLLTHSGPKWGSLHGFAGSVIALQGFPVGVVRRIPRPGQQVELTGVHHCQGRTADGKQCCETTPLATAAAGWRCAVHSPVLYGGLAPRECWHRWRNNGALVELGCTPAYMSPEQIAVAKVEHADATRGWSERLRAKVAASAEAERCRVRVDVQDVEDGGPWR